MAETYGGNPAKALSDNLGTLMATRLESKASRVVTLWGLLRSCLGESSDTDMTVMNRVVHFADLPRVVRSRVEAVSFVDPQIVLQHFNVVEQAVEAFTNPAQYSKELAFTSLPTELSEAGWQSLRLSADIIDRGLQSSTVRAADVDELISRVDDLIRTVSESGEVSGNIRIFVIERLIDIRRALELFPVAGSETVEVVFDSVLGGVLRRPDMGPAFLSSHSMGKKLASLLTSIALVLGIGVSVKELLPGSDDATSTTIENEVNSTVEVDLEVNLDPPQDGGEDD